MVGGTSQSNVKIAVYRYVVCLIKSPFIRQATFKDTAYFLHCTIVTTCSSNQAQRSVLKSEKGHLLEKHRKIAF